MGIVTRFLTSFRHEDTGSEESAGLLQNNDGTVVYVKPNGSRVELGGGGGLPTGWTQDASDPANVFTNGFGSAGEGSLTCGVADGEQFEMDSTGLSAVDEDGNLWLTIGAAIGLLLMPTMPGGGTAITIDASDGATEAMNAGGLPIIQVADPVNDQDAVTKVFVLNLGAALPTSPGAPGSLYVDTAAGHVIKVST